MLQSTATQRLMLVGLEAVKTCAYEDVPRYVVVVGQLDTHVRGQTGPCESGGQSFVFAVMHQFVVANDDAEGRAALKHMLLTRVVNHDHFFELRFFVRDVESVAHFVRMLFSKGWMGQLLRLDNWIHCGVCAFKREPNIAVDGLSKANVFRTHLVDLPRHRAKTASVLSREREIATTHPLPNHMLNEEIASRATVFPIVVNVVAVGFVVGVACHFHLCCFGIKQRIVWIMRVVCVLLLVKEQVSRREQTGFGLRKLSGSCRRSRPKRRRIGWFCYRGVKHGLNMRTSV